MWLCRQVNNRSVVGGGGGYLLVVGGGTLLSIPPARGLAGGRSAYVMGKEGEPAVDQFTTAERKEPPGGGCGI